MLEKTYEIIQAAFGHEVDKGGHPYLGHLQRVADAAAIHGENYRIVALLHDLLEDCPQWSEVQLRELYDSEIVDAVVLLTKSENKAYDEYIADIKSNSLARIVKIADLIDNMDLTRISAITEKDLERREKYKKALMMLV
jgi:(p)ppGpp synthase/HD superfamily hydrolase